MTRYEDDSLSLHTDLYQVNMVETYWRSGMHTRKAVFDLYFRDLPFGNGFGVFAGLERVVHFLGNFGMTEEDLTYLREEAGYGEDFLSYLAELRFTGSVYAMKEGELVFGNEPMIKVEAPLGEAQLIETALLNMVNYQTLIATKAARIKQVTGGNGRAMDFGLRRAQELDAGLWGSRAAFVGGFEVTSNVRAGKVFGLPTAGTHAHSMVQACETEYEAFKMYAEHHTDCVFLVDTYDTLRSGVPNAIKVAKEMGDNIRFKGVRLDSGDLAYLSKEARRMLDEAGFTDTQIIASGDLDEYTITNLKSQGAEIDTWGIGTKLITGYDQPALGAVYKLVAIENNDGGMRDTMKIGAKKSGNLEKMTTPGVKKVYRIINTENKRSEGDYITLSDEEPNEQEELHMFHPVHTYISKKVQNFKAVNLHETIFQDGRLVYGLPSMKDIQAYMQSNLPLLWEEYKRSLNPEEYPVDLSPKCWENKVQKMHEIQNEFSQ
ncbi:nicotinate phosphoribosyltransferase [uncultured Marinococcus sp.]|uniref:nicotinate phosphoribosyltransferase n=1 Tax=uncultured Marinococcus sp. TaxID=487012 RepID=UPI0026296C2C|nr:nicotinate phosphoribosyltransferase [uncultured Marinococcus sp.]